MENESSLWNALANVRGSFFLQFIDKRKGYKYFSFSSDIYSDKDTNLFSSDIYSKSNPGGYVNLGTAVNGLCEGKLKNNILSSLAPPGSV